MNTLYFYPYVQNSDKSNTLYFYPNVQYLSSISNTLYFYPNVQYSPDIINNTLTINNPSFTVTYGNVDVSVNAINITSNINIVTPTFSNLDYVNIIESFENDTLALPFIGTWSRTTTAPYSGTYCYGSRIGTKDRENSMTFLKFKTVKNGVLSFYYRISTENYADGLFVNIDGTQVLENKTICNWTKFSKNITAGIHYIIFYYVKDSSTSANENRVYIDDLYIENYSYYNFNNGTLEDFEDTNYNLPLTGSWVLSTFSPAVGTYCLASNNHTDSSSSSMTLTKTFSGNAKISFFYSVDSETNYDKFLFYVNSTNKFTISGTTIWKYYEQTYTAGTYIFEWKYTKDSSGSIYTDAAYLDNLSIYEENSIAAISSVVIVTNAQINVPVINIDGNIQIKSENILTEFKIPKLSIVVNDTVKVMVSTVNMKTPNTSIIYKTLKMKVNGNWVTVINMYIKVLGVWKPIDKVYSKTNGSWKEI